MCSDCRFWALATRQYPATARRATPCARDASEPVSSLYYGLFRLYFPGELRAEELQAKKTRYWQQFYESLAQQSTEQRLIKPYLAP